LAGAGTLFVMADDHLPSWDGELAGGLAREQDHSAAAALRANSISENLDRQEGINVTCAWVVWQC
jgi:hypothetical protein